MIKCIVRLKNSGIYSDDGYRSPNKDEWREKYFNFNISIDLEWEAITDKKIHANRISKLNIVIQFILFG